MSAEHSQHAPVRLLIAESSENSAHEFDSMLRDAGIPTRMRLIDLPTAGEALDSADLMLCNAELPHLEQILPQLRTRAPHVPIILVNAAEQGFSTSQGMRLGAADVVSRADPDELVLVFKRELAHVCQGQKLSELHRALKEAEQRCQLLLQSSQAAIAYVHEGMHIHANPGYLKLFGFEDADDLLGLPLMDLLADSSAEDLKQVLKRFRNDGEECTLDFAGRATDGAEILGNMTLAPAEYEGEPCMQVIVRTAPARPAPPAESDAANGAAEANGHAANGDAAAGAPAPNGAAVDATASGVGTFLAAARGMLDSVNAHRAVLVAQIDGFARLQGELGLRGSEELSASVQRALQQALDSRPCARLSAHQFAFAVTDGDRNAVLDRTESLRKTVEGMMTEVHGKTVRATLSIGGTELDEELGESGGDPIEAALNTAFAAALRAAEEGGNRVELLTKEVAREEPDSEAGQILAQINEAIDNQRFLLLFQPIISLRGDSEEHYEVFLRMMDRDGKKISPGEFLRTAIEHGVAAKIDRWVILQSIKMLSTHRAKGHNTRLTINLTANSIADPEFLQWLSVAIKAARLPSDAVIFQITEQDASDLVRQTREFVEGLKGMHCRASLSRFGLRDNPMEMLDHIPVDFVKLDGSHIERLMDDPDLKDEITGMIRDLQGKGKLTIIPMVESAGVLSALWQAGANYIQGHYLQEPSTEMDFDFSTDD
ncbi:MAG: ferrous iron transporter C [Gammaproteobacteria bacterium]|nr:ferrous iron transporter C [Gammaproteobacteria bacterium]MBK80605.1 ferrous iron transporter C [Gammaproteobacteria bacterium]